MGGFFEIFIDNDKWSINLAIEYQFHRGLDHTRWRQRSHMLHPVYTNALRMLDTDVIAADTRLRHQAMPAYVAGGGLAKEIGQKTTPRRVMRQWVWPSSTFLHFLPSLQQKSSSTTI